MTTDPVEHQGMPNGQRPASPPDQRDPQAPSGPASEVLGDLEQVSRHTVDLLTELGYPPRTTRIQACAITVDIDWADAAEPAPAAEQHRPTGPAPTAAATAAAAHATGSAAAGSAASAAYLSSPAVGVFYRARVPGAEPFVSVGSVVRPGQQIGIVEAMKLMIPVEADRAGRIAAVLKANGEAVEYGEPLFALEPERGVG